jgi:hypothetical protein
MIDQTGGYYIFSLFFVLLIINLSKFRVYILHILLHSTIFKP